jgi:hypothetical protein
MPTPPRLQPLRRSVVHQYLREWRQFAIVNEGKSVTVYGADDPHATVPTIPVDQRVYPGLDGPVRETSGLFLLEYHCCCVPPVRTSPAERNGDRMCHCASALEALRCWSVHSRPRPDCALLPSWLEIVTTDCGVVQGWSEADTRLCALPEAGARPRSAADAGR